MRVYSLDRQDALRTETSYQTIYEGGALRGFFNCIGEAPVTIGSSRASAAACMCGGEGGEAAGSGPERSAVQSAKAHDIIAETWIEGIVECAEAKPDQPCDVPGRARWRGQRHVDMPALIVKPEQAEPHGSGAFLALSKLRTEAPGKMSDRNSYRIGRHNRLG